MIDGEDFDCGYKEGMKCCLAGFVYDCIADGPIDTEWAHGYVYGWDIIKALGLHGSEREKFQREQNERNKDLYISPEVLEYLRGWDDEPITEDVKKEIFW